MRKETKQTIKEISIIVIKFYLMSLLWFLMFEYHELLTDCWLFEYLNPDGEKLQPYHVFKFPAFMVLITNALYNAKSLNLNYHI